MSSASLPSASEDATSAVQHGYCERISTEEFERQRRDYTREQVQQLALHLADLERASRQRVGWKDALLVILMASLAVSVAVCRDGSWNPQCGLSSGNFLSEDDLVALQQLNVTSYLSVRSRCESMHSEICKAIGVWEDLLRVESLPERLERSKSLLNSLDDGKRLGAPPTQSRFSRLHLASQN
jgi:hypothetical protein